MKEKKENKPEKAGETAPKQHHLAPWQFKPGQSGNPAGRPPGPSLKEWAKSYLERMNDEERLEFIAGLNKSDIWKMAEGNPAQGLDLSGKVDTGVELTDEQLDRIIKQRTENTTRPEGS